MTDEDRIKDLEYQLVIDRNFFRGLYDHGNLEKDDRMHASLRVHRLDTMLGVTDLDKARTRIDELKDTLREIYELLTTVGPEHCSQEIVDMIAKALK